MAKRRKAKDLILINLCIYLILMTTIASAKKAVYKVVPKFGSMGGGTKLTITGEGFSNEQTSVPNSVRLISDSNYYTCDVLTDFTNEGRIECETQHILGDTYTVRVGVGGQYLQPKDHCPHNGKGDGFHSDCQFKTDEDHTPRITAIVPRSQSDTPGQIIKIIGKIMSGHIDATKGKDEIKNGVVYPILRVYAGNQPCELKKNDDELYGLALDNGGESKYGSITCKMNGNFIGNSDINFIVDGDYGRSLPDPKLKKVAANDEIYLFQTYPVITGLSPSKGSTEGGLSLEIRGNYFDPALTTKVMIAGSECTMPKVTKDTITCMTGAKSSWPSNPGNRGALLEIWNNTQKSYDDLIQISAFTGEESDYSARYIDELYHKENEPNTYRVKGFLVPPHNGVYTVLVRGKNAAKVFLTHSATDDNDNKDPAKKTEVVTMPTSSTTFKSSDRITLKKGVEYFYEVLHQGDLLEVGLKHFNTKHTSDTTGLAKPEKQKLKFKSTVVREKQTLTLPGSTEETAVHEVQKVTVIESGDLSDASFKLGMYGVYTGSITTAATAEYVERKVMELPFFHSHESISVTKSDPTGKTRGAVFDITFNSSRGNFSSFDFKTKPSSNDENTVTVSIDETTAGQPSGKYVAIQHEGVIAPLFTTTASKNDVAVALSILYGTRCSKLLTNPKDKFRFYDYENSIPSGAGGKQTNKVEPFCGRKVVENPTYLYRGDPLPLSTKLNMVCFAYLGNQLQDKIRLDYTYKEGEEDRNKQITLAATFNKSPGWHYFCLQMLDELKEKHPSSPWFYIRMIRVYKKGDIADFFIDDLLMGKSAAVPDIENINDYRMLPAKPNGGLIESVIVTSSEVGVYKIELVPHDCAFNFPLFKQVPGQKVGDVDVVQESEASPPLTGTFKVSYKDSESKDFSFDIKGHTLATEMEGLEDIGNLDIERIGSCSNFEYIITFLSLPGDVEQIQIDGSNIQGIEVEVTNETIQNGYLQYDTIPGDLLRIFYTEPQVSVVMEGIPAKCEGDCTFMWDVAITPTLVGSSPCCGVPGTVITLTGTGFDSTPENNVVTIGDNPCTVTEVSTDGTTLNCTTPSVPRSIGPIKVNVKDKGYATHPTGSKIFIFTLELTNFSPKKTKLGGGITLTCNGNGFDADDIKVTVGGETCKNTETSITMVKCTLPARPKGTHKITVTTTKQTKEYSDGIEYVELGTPRITSISPETTGVGGGDQMTISGQGFGDEAKVYLGDNKVDVQSTDTEITGTVPPLANGDYNVLVFNEDGAGAAVDSNGNVPTMKRLTKVTQVNPLFGSWKGGTRVYLTGQGFGNKKSDVKVKLGDIDCDVETVEATKIVCLIEYTGKVISITNQGKNKLYGVGYAWDPPVATTKVGNIVKWTLTTPFYFEDNFTPMVMQTLNRTTIERTKDGFESLASPNGIFKYEMTKVGRYDYSSNYIEEYEIIKYAGTIIVIAKDQSIEDVVVEVGGQKVHYDVNSGVSTFTGACETISLISGCTEASPTGGTTDMFNFKFQTCSTPVLTAINITEGTTMDEIIIDGNGFSSVGCQNEVMIGSDVCKVTSSSEIQIKCKLDAADSPEIGLRQEYKVRVNNRGYALNSMMGQIERTFVLLPMISKFSPTEGSLNGGTTFTITGSGFHGDKSNIDVYINVNRCDVKSKTYTEIVCITPPLQQGKRLVEVIVRANANDVGIKAVCKRIPSCEFDYQLLATPKLDDINPKELDGSATKVTIQGSGFGNVKDNVMVTIGDVKCEVDVSVNVPLNDNEIKCDISNVPVGEQTVMVINKVKGKATNTNNKKITSLAVISSVIPIKGSTHGGTMITITGNGFTSDTTVKISGATCAVEERSLSRVVCKNIAHEEQTVPVVIEANGKTYNQKKTFEYSSSVTPVVTVVSFPTNTHGGTIEVTGSGFSTVMTENTVAIGSADCIVTSSDGTTIKCTAPPLSVGSHKVTVHVAGKGLSNSDKSVVYNLLLTSISKTSGSVGGGQKVTLTGSGFDDTTVAKVCSEECKKDTTATQTATELICFVPMASGTVAVSKVCSVEVSSSGTVNKLTNAYTYMANLTPTITSVDPWRGGTGGGVTLSIEGSGFGSDPGVVDVSIAGTPCTDVTVTPNLITCKTGAHSPSIIAKVKVEINKNGDAIETAEDKSIFQYIDIWSSEFTWGGSTPPGEGGLAVITEGQIILLDISTPVLKTLLIQGGELIFDEADIELNAEIILITNGGKLKVGTEDKPFQNKATITLHGHVRSKELPLYGTKCIAVRNGTLDMHGKNIPVTWTLLAETASAGTNTIKLKSSVSWKTGDKIVIVSTGMGNSVSENEEHTIETIGSDGVSITLKDSLKHKHLGVTENVNGIPLEYRAEVGLLTRNVLVRGSIHDEWKDKIEACPDGFQVGQFAVQTCFQGRFGEEIGSDRFGAQSMFSPPNTDQSNVANGRFSNVEMYHVGQAFRRGRYPIHFHLAGNVNDDSYVKKCAIHKSFNRAVNIHGTHNLTVEHNVIYDIMGGAVFLEDGIEKENTIKYNLVAGVKGTSSLLTDDVTAAAFWITNPTNIVKYNHAAGGSHFGYWYRLEPTPRGPSKTDEVNPNNGVMGTFVDNVAHSLGWFGLWVFEEYFPRDNGMKSGSPVSAEFKHFFAWLCEKGAEFVIIGALQLKNSNLVQNQIGLVVKMVTEGDYYCDTGAIATDLFIYGGSPLLPSLSSPAAIEFPLSNRFLVKDITIKGYMQVGAAAFIIAHITGLSGPHNGGFTYNTQNLTFEEVKHKVKFQWEHHGVFRDMDGTLYKAGWSVLPYSKILPGSPVCEELPGFTPGQIEAVACDPSISFTRFSFNKVEPDSLNFKKAQITDMSDDQGGNTTSPWEKKRTTHPKGWMFVLIKNRKYHLDFENHEHVTNISFHGTFYLFENGDWLIFSVKVAKKPDCVQTDGVCVKEKEGELDGQGCHGDWKYKPNDRTVSYLVTLNCKSRKKRSTTDLNAEIPIKFKLYKCKYKDCIVPKLNEVPLLEERPDDVKRWSNNESWPSGNIPLSGDCVTIEKGIWMVGDTVIPPLKCLILHGVLELEDSDGVGGFRSFEIKTGFILITKEGRLIVGFNKDEPFRGTLHIILQGNHNTDNYILPSDEISLGKKFIAVFGGLDLNGIHVDPPWTTLAVQGEIGDNTITVNKEVDWVVGFEIMVTTTGYNSRETETFKLTKVATGGGQSVLTLDSTLKYKHLVHTETINGNTYTIQTEVGLLSRYITVEGEDSNEESFGGMITVGLSSVGAGFMRISYTELRYMGQEGYVESYDPHYPIAYVDTGKPTPNRPAYVIGNSIHHCYSPGIGVYNMNDLKIEFNVIFSTLRYAIETTSDSTQIRNNLVSVVQFSGTYRDRMETSNPLHNGAMSAMKATNLILENNALSGAERVCYHVPPQRCGATTGLYSNNIARTCLIAVAVLPEDKLSGDCQKITGFSITKSLHYAVYYNNGASVQIIGVTIGDGTVAIFAMIIGPPALHHSYADKYVLIKKVLIIGMSSAYDCNTDVVDMSDANIKLATTSRPEMNRIVGIFPGQFTSSGNEFPFKPANGIMSYPAIKGITRVENVTFSGFSNKCSKTGSAFATNPNNEDGQHPVEVEGLTFEGVPMASRVYYDLPNVNLIDSSNCGDMACDAMKKMLIVDKDGSIGDNPGTVIPKSEINWDGPDKRFGIGDFRIPKTLLSTTTGARIDADELAKYKGIIRNQTCTYYSDWHAYWCPYMNHKMLIAESMDEDTETRQVSPLAILGHESGDGYLDLCNGPQDHGWCNGYTCRKRLSTFMLLVITGKFYKLHFTGTTPLWTRYFLLNSDEDEAIVLAVWYAQPFRLDVYYRNQFVLPKNGVWKSRDGKKWFNYLPEGEINQYVPYPTEPPGTNWFNRDTSDLYVVVRGSIEVEIKTVSDAIFVSFKYAPVITVDDFFAECCVEFLMEFFDLTEDKLRVTNIISASSRRRKRSTDDGGVLFIEISNGPKEESNGTIPNPLSMEDLLKMYSKAVAEGQLGNFSYVLNSTVIEVSVVKPKDPTDQSWATINITTPEGSYRVLVQVDNLAIHQEIDPNYEGLPFKTQPIIKVLDSYGNRISELGTLEYPWFLTATLSGGNQSAELIGNTTVQFVDGWATFTDLGINHYGSGYIINFTISSPAQGENYTVASDMLTIPARQIQAVMIDPTPQVYEQTELNVMFELRDSNTEVAIENIEWRDHVWIVEAELGKPELYDGSLIGTKQVRFDASDARATLFLQLTMFGMYVIRYHITSTPLDYEYYLEYIVTARGQHHQNISMNGTTEMTEITLRFRGDYTTIVGNEENYVASYLVTWYAHQFPTVEVLSGKVSPGSIMLTLTINGTTYDINETIHTTCEILKNDTTLLSYNGYNLTLAKYMLRDGRRICNGGKGSGDSDDDPAYLLPVIISCSLIGFALLVIIVFCLWKCKVHPKTKTEDVRNYYKDIDEILFREKSFMSIGSKVNHAPIATNITLGTYHKKKTSDIFDW